MTKIYLPRFPLEHRRQALVDRAMPEFDSLPYGCKQLKDAITMDCTGRLILWFNDKDKSTHVVREERNEKAS